MGNKYLIFCKDVRGTYQDKIETACCSMAFMVVLAIMTMESSCAESLFVYDVVMKKMWR